MKTASKNSLRCDSVEEDRRYLNIIKKITELIRKNKANHLCSNIQVCKDNIHNVFQRKDMLLPYSLDFATFKTCFEIVKNITSDDNTSTSKDTIESILDKFLNHEDICWRNNEDLIHLLSNQNYKKNPQTLCDLFKFLCCDESYKMLIGSRFKEKIKKIVEKTLKEFKKMNEEELASYCNVIENLNKILQSDKKYTIRFIFKNNTINKEIIDLKSCINNKDSIGTIQILQEISVEESAHFDINP